MSAPRALRAWVALVAATSAVLAGCARENPDAIVQSDFVIVYVGVSLDGPGATQGRAVLDGIKLALADQGGSVGPFTVTVTAATDTRGRPARPDPHASAQHARRAAQDSRSLAYLGDLHSETTRTTLPILNEGLIPQIAPGAPATGLTRSASGTHRGEPGTYRPTARPTFVRLPPAGDAEGRAAAAWAADEGAETAVVVADPDDPDSGPRAAAFASAFRAEGGRVLAEVPLDLPGLRQAGRLGPDAVYAPDDVLGDGEPAPFEAARRIDDALILGSETALWERDEADGLTRSQERRLRLVSPAVPAERLGREGRRFAAAYEAEFGEPPDPWAAYGYESMALLLDAVERTGDDARDRRRIAAEMISTRDRDSVLGRYSVTPDGDTTIDRLGGYLVEDGEGAFDRVLTDPARR